MSIVYRFEDQDIEIGHTHPIVDEWAQSDGAERWMILTAENPWGEEFPKFINKQRSNTLRDILYESPFSFKEGVGEAEGYPTEVVFLIWGATLEEIAELGCEMSQHAFIHGFVGAYAEVVTINNGGQG